MKRIIIGLVALLCTACIPAPLNSFLPEGGSDSFNPVGRVPATAKLYPDAAPGEMCSSPVGPLVQALSYDGTPRFNFLGDPVMVPASMPCSEMYNPCSMTDKDRTTMFVTDHFYCVEVDIYGERTVRIGEQCSLPYAEFYGCRP